MALIEFENKPSTDTPINATNLNHNFNELDIGVNKIGKLLWSGNFTSGSITVEGISNYTLIAVNVDGVLCLGYPYYGGCSFGGFGTAGIATYAYRFDVNGEVLTIDNYNQGGTNGTNNIPVLAIYGIF